jgi:hypothetical protein
MSNNPMTTPTPTSQVTVPPTEEVETDDLQAPDPQEQEEDELRDNHSADGYDANIIPAEIAARREREGKNFKHLPRHPAGSESIDTTGGFTVDREGLVDNFGIEPEMYYETPGDVPTEETDEPELLDR